jgi:molybdopterin converting factor small subunit
VSKLAAKELSRETFLKLIRRLLLRLNLQTVSELKNYFGSGELEVEFSQSTVAELLEHLKRRYNFDIGVQKHTMLFVNGRGCVNYSRRLKDGDHIAIVPIMAAG